MTAWLAGVLVLALGVTVLGETSEPGGQGTGVEGTAGLRPDPTGGDDGVTLPPPPPEIAAAPDAEGRVAERQVTGPRWMAELPEPISAIELADDLVVVATGSTVHAFGRAEGEAGWERAWPHVGVVDVVALDGRVLVILRDGDVVGLASSDGSEAWRARGGLAGSMPAGELLLLGDGQRLRALRVDDGGTAWERDIAGVVAGGTACDTVAVATEDAVVGLDPATGSRRWERALRGAGSPHQSCERLVASTPSGLAVLDPADGRLVATLRESRDLGARVRGQPRVIGDQVVVSVGEGLVGVDASGEPAWRADMPRRASLVDAGRTAAAVTGGVTLHLLAPETGVELARLTPSGWFTAMALDDRGLAVAVHTPTRGRLYIHDPGLSDPAATR